MAKPTSNVWPNGQKERAKIIVNKSNGYQRDDVHEIRIPLRAWKGNAIWEGHRRAPEVC